jgi:predicted nucleotidyltransferase
MSGRIGLDVFAGVGAEAAKHPRIVAAWVFGSVARGDTTGASDLDVAVLLRAERDDRQRDDLEELAAALERYSPTGQVDVLVLGEQGPVLRHRILKEGRLVHDASPTERIDFEGRTIAEYLDWKPTHEIAMQATFRGLRDRFARGGR